MIFRNPHISQISAESLSNNLCESATSVDEKWPLPALHSTMPL